MEAEIESTSVGMKLGAVREHWPHTPVAVTTSVEEVLTEMEETRNPTTWKTYKDALLGGVEEDYELSSDDLEEVESAIDNNRYDEAVELLGQYTQEVEV